MSDVRKPDFGHAGPIAPYLAITNSLRSQHTEMAPALAEAGAAYARAVAPFDGNNAEELAAARAQWKELKDLGFALTYWQQGANGRWEMKS